MTAPYYQEPPEAQSIKSMLHIVRILAIIFGVILFLIGLGYAAVIATGASACSAAGGGPYCGAAVGILIIPAIFIIIFGVIDIIIYMQMKSIEALVNSRQYEVAKSKTLLWMIIGFILGGIIIGILLLIAYLKYDPLINAQRAAMGQSPPGSMPPPMAPQPGYGAPPPAPMPPAPPMQGAAAPAGTAQFCPKCGKPTTYIAQYGRYYCYDDKVYV